jgi:DNA polymerase III alpha subunit
MSTMATRSSSADVFVQSGVVTDRGYRDMSDLVRRVGLTAGQLALATADAFACFGLTRRRLAGEETGRRVRVGGIVTHRQRPATAGGVTFLNLEDETGMLNVICSPGLWQRYRRVARTSTALVVRGRLEKHEGVTNLVADRLDAITAPVNPTSRDFR